jgi:sugar/nucleoside kinase (ribokinase family)
VGEEAFADLLQVIRHYENVLFEGLKSFSQRQNRVTLKCLSQDAKEETAELALPSLTFEQIAEHLSGLDFLLINFTSGRDLTQEALAQVRQAYTGPILLDVHSLTLGDPDSKGRRRLRVLRDWKEWLAGMDYVQFTWKEAASLTGQNKTTVSGLVEIADWLLQNGSKGVIVTRGSEGTYYFHSDEQGILKEEIPAFPLQTVVDTTGCGDVFSAAFIYRLLCGYEGIEATHFANRAAALKATFSGIGPWLA